MKSTGCEINVIDRVVENEVVESLIDGIDTARRIQAHSIAIVMAGEDGYISTASARAGDNAFQIVGALEELKLRILRGGS